MVVLRRTLTPQDIRPGNRSLAPLDGLIGAFDAPEEVRVVQRLRIPTVNFSSNTKSSLPSVLTDNRAVGRIAARHLLDCGLSNFAYIASPSLLFSQHRGEGFAAALCSADRDVTTFTLKDPRLSRLLAGLPKPTGVFANNDFAAQRFIALCRETGWRVPDDFAVLGVDNGFDSRMSDMEFSSIDPGAERVGYKAAQLLERLLRGEPAPSAPILARQGQTAKIEIRPIAHIRPRSDTVVHPAAEPRAQSRCSLPPRGLVTGTPDTSAGAWACVVSSFSV